MYNGLEFRKCGSVLHPRREALHSFRESSKLAPHLYPQKTIPLLHQAVLFLGVIACNKMSELMVMCSISPPLP